MIGRARRASCCQAGVAARTCSVPLPVHATLVARPSVGPAAMRHANATFAAEVGASADPTRKFALIEGADKNKDQSYFLALLSQAQLRDALFPIGHLRKPELRALADDAKLPNARKKDSQGICFIGEVKMADFLKAYVPEHPGPIVRATDGKILGEHRGDLREDTGLVRHVEADVVARGRVPHGLRGKRGVGRLARTTSARDLVARHGDQVAEHRARRRGATGTLPVEHHLPRRVGLDGREDTAA